VITTVHSVDRRAMALQRVGKGVWFVMGVLDFTEDRLAKIEVKSKASSRDLGFREGTNASICYVWRASGAEVLLYSSPIVLEGSL
jgi:hypothetical protein